MSTTPLPDGLISYLLESSLSLLQQGADPSRPPVIWMLTFPNGKRLSSLDGPWSSHATLREIDGLPAVPVIPSPAEGLDLFYAGRLYTLRPPEPVPFFSFARMASSCSFPLCDEEEEQGSPIPPPPVPPPSCWLYSVFGYVLPQYRFTLLMSETQVRTEISQHHDVFLLP